jgi:hypothetical protein
MPYSMAAIAFRASIHCIGLFGLRFSLTDCGARGAGSKIRASVQCLALVESLPPAASRCRSISGRVVSSVEGLASAPSGLTSGARREERRAHAKPRRARRTARAFCVSFAFVASSRDTVTRSSDPLFSCELWNHCAKTSANNGAMAGTIRMEQGYPALRPRFIFSSRRALARGAGSKVGPLGRTCTFAGSPLRPPLHTAAP